jgi:hypothetical protein
MLLQEMGCGLGDDMLASRARADSSSVRAVRGEKTGPNQTDRRKAGSKHHLLTDAQGIPLASDIARRRTEHGSGLGKTRWWWKGRSPGCISFVGYAYVMKNCRRFIKRTFRRVREKPY